MMMMKQQQKIWLIGAVIVIIALGGTLRVWSLPRPPAGPYYDEAANGILASGIANEGYRPIFITSYTGKEVLFFYAAALAIKILGSNLLALRLTSALLGTLTIIAALWCVWELYATRGAKRPHALALLTAGLLATSFWHLVLSRVGLRAVAQPLLQTLTLALLWRGLRDSRWWELVAAGLLCGLTGYTYLAARLFPIPLALALLTLLIADRGNWQKRLAQIATFLGAGTAAFAPLGLYFLRNPERFAVRIEQVASQGDTLTLAQAFSRALGIFFIAGDPLSRINLPGKPIFGPLLAVAFLFGLALTLFRLVTERDPLGRARDVLLLAWIPAMILPTALTVADIIPHHLRAAGLLPLIYLFPALSIAWLLERTSRWTNLKLVLALGLLLAWTAPAAARDYFVHLAERTDHYEISDGDLADMAEWLNAADLTGADRQETVYIASIHYRHPTLAFLADDFTSFKWLTGGRTVVAPTQGSALLLVPRSIDYRWAKPYLTLSAGLDTDLPAIPIGPDQIPAFDAYHLDADTPLTVSHKLHVDFSHVIQLEGYDLLGEPGTDRAVDLLLGWQVLNPAPSGDFHVFVHLLDSWGLPWGDSLPFQYPSAQWTPGERFLDRIRVELPPGTPPGEYTLQVGLYSPERDKNLTVIGADGAFAGVLTSIPVTLAASAELEPLGEIRRPLDTELAPGLRLLGVNLDTLSARTREPIHLALFWQAGRLLDDVEIRLLLGDQILYQGAPVHGTYPTSAWRANEGVTDRYNPRVPLNMAAGDWPLTVQVLTSDSDGDSHSAELGRVEIIAPERSETVPQMQERLNVAWQETVELLGVDLTGLDSSTVELTLYWRALREMEEAYTVFIHLVAADNALAGQVDRMPQGGAYPTSLWAAGEVIADHYQIPVTPNVALPLSIKVGMYLPTTGEQLGEIIILE